MVTDAYSVREGLGEAAAFYRSHPLLNFSYFAIVIGVTMFAMHPVFLLSSFFMAWCYSILLRGITLNVHNGVTVLFYLNDNRITLEAIIYGLASAIMLTSVIIWFSCFSVIVTADKFIYLFGRAAPVLACKTFFVILSYGVRLIFRALHSASCSSIVFCLVRS